MTILQTLRSITAYPVPAATLEEIARGCGLPVEEEASPQMRADYATELKRATARVYLHLSMAPNVSQNGVSFSFSSDERRQFRNMARALLGEIGDDITALTGGVRYGYVGESF